MYQKQGYHIVDVSPWPIIASSGAGVIRSGVVIYIHGYNGGFLGIFGRLRLLGTIYVWGRDVVREGTREGQHTSRVQVGIRYGMRFFIFTEVILFASVFWAYLYAGVSPTVEIGGVWPPKGIESLNPYEVPRRNTGLLLRSGVSVTWAHHSILAGDRANAIKAIRVTIELGVVFTLVQAFEYVDASFTVSDTVYGSAFYIGTGLHGIHVIMGTIRLTIGRIRRWKHQYTKEHHRGLEVSIWYWHFVDVVWLVLYIIIYVWGS